MNEGRDVWSGGTSRDKSEVIHKSLRTTLRNVFQPEILFPKIVRPSKEELLEKQVEAAWEEVQKRREERSRPFRGNSSVLEKTSDAASAGESGSQKINKELVEKVLKESGFDKLPMTDKARQILEGALSNGARPVTEYTGKVMLERAIPEEPPAFVRPGQLNVGDRIISLQWMPVGLFGAKFDLPMIPPTARIKKMYSGPVKVSKNAYPPGRVPTDPSKVETTTEERLWALDLEEDGIKKSNDDHSPCPMITKDTTMVLRLEPLAAPSGETKE